MPRPWGWAVAKRKAEAEASLRAPDAPPVDEQQSPPPQQLPQQQQQVDASHISPQVFPQVAVAVDSSTHHHLATSVRRFLAKSEQSRWPSPASTRLMRVLKLAPAGADELAWDPYVQGSMWSGDVRVIVGVVYTGGC